MTSSIFKANFTYEIKKRKKNQRTTESKAQGEKCSSSGCRKAMIEHRSNSYLLTDLSPLHLSNEFLIH